jgi:WD40 repeat protein
VKLIRRIEFENPPIQIRFSRDGERLWANTRDEFCEINLRMPDEIRVKPTLFAVDMAFLDAERIVIANLSRPRTLLIYNTKQQRIISQVYTDDVRSVCVDYHHQRIFVGTLETNDGDEYIVGIYDWAGHPQKRFKVRSMPFCMELSHSGDKLAIASVYFEVWDVFAQPKGVYTDQLEGDCTGTPCEANSVDITPDGHYAVAGFHGGKGLCVVVDTTSDSVIRWLGPEGDEMNYYAANDVAISPDGKYVAVAAANFKTVPVYRVSDGTVVYKYPVSACGTVAFSPKGDILAMSDANSIFVWEFTL